jgi:hydroxymethylglutaryl-CoA reductase
MGKTITGFSKLDKIEKINWLTEAYFNGDKRFVKILSQYWNNDQKLQTLHDEFIENTITNFYLPLGIAPNFEIDSKTYAIPMVIEESSVVAAASNAAKFWQSRGGFRTSVISTKKVGQVHLDFNGTSKALLDFFNAIKATLLKATSEITKNMESRGGGITAMELRDKTDVLDGYYQIHVNFETMDAMGANFINSCLEQIAKTFKFHFDANDETEGNLEIIMSILSNYVPECIVKAEVSCHVEELSHKTINGSDFAKKFVRAIKIAQNEPYRAVTHNKGIMNGVDAVILATGNDFRAIEAGVHAYASRDGRYRSLSDAKIENGIFTFSIELPLALGTVGGLTKLHPLVKLCLNLLQNPSAKELMSIVAVAGLAQNFAAVKSLVTTGIQEGHMKMHLLNILNQHQASSTEKEIIQAQFKEGHVTHKAVVDAIEKLRQ